MNFLVSLKEKLKNKPEVHPNLGVKVILAPPTQKLGVDFEAKPKTLITAEKDEGKRATDILEAIRHNKLTAVIKKHPEEIKEYIPPQAPVIQDKIKNKPKKILAKYTIQEDVKDNEDVKDIPEGGPRLEEDNVQEDNNLQEDNVVEYDQIIVPVNKPKKRTTKKVIRGVIPLGTDLMLQIGDTTLAKRLPPIPVVNVNVSSYYMNNREIFVNFINGLFETYKDDLLDESKGISCEDIGKDTGELSLLTHQKIVRDYMNLFTPYRGLLLFHGLGSGKTCSSIAIAEGMKNGKKVYILTPASLRRNYIEEIKKCGDLIYRKNQFWEWISVDDTPELAESLSASLGLPVEYIRRHRGAWLVNITKPSNYIELSTTDKTVLNAQLDEMIRNKYTFINYNGLRREKFRSLTSNFEKNIFDDSVVIIDEAHNLISRIVNKINKISKFAEKKRGPGELLPQSLSLLLYEFLLKADNCRVVLLTGTPIINYPNEIGVLFNILRGYIKSWKLTLNNETNKVISNDKLQELFSKEKVLDYFDYVPSSKTLTITRNPYGTENRIMVGVSGYNGVTNKPKEKRDKNHEIERDAMGDIIYEKRGSISDADFIMKIVKLLKKNDINVETRGTTFTVNTALPDTLDEFINSFINKETGKITNIEKFKRRIIGLTSYFRSAQEELLPSYDKDFDKHAVFIPMSDYQFKIYEDYRHEERKVEKPSKKTSGVVDKDGVFKEPSSTYRIFSRLACNFVMPTPPGRPNPAGYRLIGEAKKNEQLLNWMKETYFNDDTHEFNDDIQQKYESFKTKIPDENLTKYNLELQNIISLYLKEYFTKNNREPIEEFAKKNGYTQIFEKNIQPNLIANVNVNLQPITDKAVAKATKATNAEEKATNAEAKATKAEAKATRAEAKAEAKADKEQAKAEAKEEKDRQKADEKAIKLAEKEQIKQDKKAEKNLKGGNEDESEDDSDDESETNDEDDSDDDIDSEDNYIDDNTFAGGDGSSNPAELFVDKHEEDENIIIDGYKDEDAILREYDELESDEILEKMGSIEYTEAIKAALRYLKIHSQQYLTKEGLQTYSPKFLHMLENIEDPEHQGLHLIYSQFRSMEGIGIFTLTLDANGFARFKIKKNEANSWIIDMSEEEMGKPCYALYTGTENAEEREIIRNIYNGSWDNIPNNIATQLKAKSSNNNLGEIIKVLMITSAGSEGINLRNTRYVHIMEPYWHPVRVEQVIGRARRICSHQSLPKALQTVEVFVYIMTFTEAQLNSEFAIELKLKDLSKHSPYTPQTSDQKLFEISNIKEQLTSQLLMGIKAASIDCATHSKSNTKEGLVCLSFGQPGVNQFSYKPDISQDENDTIADINKTVIAWDARPFTDKSTGKQYMLRVDTYQIYDYDSVIMSRQVPGVRPILLGKLIKRNNGNYEIIKERI